MEEDLEGHVVDIACLRKYPHDELAVRAREHSRLCLLMGHCQESGYGLVGGDGRIMLLDAKATPQVVAAAEASARDRGIRLRAHRAMEDGEMVTRHIDET